MVDITSSTDFVRSYMQLSDGRRIKISDASIAHTVEGWTQLTATAERLGTAKISWVVESGTSLADDYYECTNPISSKALYMRASFDWVDGDDTCTSSTKYVHTYPRQSAKDRLRAVLRSRVFPAIRTTRSPLELPADERERRARETLRRVVGEAQHRNYLTHGFVTARAKSGRHYQIFPGMKMTKVFEQGKLMEELCTYVAGQFPPTDQVIVRFLMILNSEADFRQRSNVYDRTKSRPIHIFPAPLKVDERSLVDIYKGFTRKVA